MRKAAVLGLLLFLQGLHADEPRPERFVRIPFNRCMNDTLAAHIPLEIVLPGDYVSKPSAYDLGRYWGAKEDLDRAVDKEGDLKRGLLARGVFLFTLTTQVHYDGQSGKFTGEDGKKAELAAAGLRNIEVTRREIWGHPALLTVSDGPVCKLRTLYFALDPDGNVLVMSYIPPTKDIGRDAAVWDAFVGSFSFVKADPKPVEGKDASGVVEEALRRLSGEASYVAEFKFGNLLGAEDAKARPRAEYACVMEKRGSRFHRLKLSIDTSDELAWEKHGGRIHHHYLGPWSTGKLGYELSLEGETVRAGRGEEIKEVPLEEWKRMFAHLPVSVLAGDTTFSSVLPLEEVLAAQTGLFDLRQVGTEGELAILEGNIQRDRLEERFKGLEAFDELQLETYCLRLTTMKAWVSKDRGLVRFEVNGTRDGHPYRSTFELTSLKSGTP